jgi:hypothetical protein
MKAVSSAAIAKDKLVQQAPKVQHARQSEVGGRPNAEVPSKQQEVD